MEIEQALSALLDEVAPVNEIETVPLHEATGRVLAEGVTAPFAVPHFPKAAMDGYAVKAETVKAATKENPVRLKVVGEMLAGDAGYVNVPNEIDTVDGEGVSAGSDNSDGGLTKALDNCAVRIMTGACVPEDFDAVVKQEDTDYGETEALIYKGVEPYMNYCKVGEDIQEGSPVLAKGRRVGRTEAGVLASLGITRVEVVRRLKVSVISTGSELVNLEEDSGISGAAPEKGKIYNSIAYTLSASLYNMGFEADCSICADDEQRIEESIRQALDKSDVVITTGGVSVGKKDLLPEVLDRIGAKRVFSRVNIQPGTPTIGSVLNGKAILSLSGNPYAALVNYDLYFMPLAAKLTGCAAYLPVRERTVLQSEYNKANSHRRFLRAKVEDGRVYLTAKAHASSVLSNLLDCNCYIDLKEETALKPGDEVTIIRLPD